jgi:hypothetical protein
MECTCEMREMCITFRPEDLKRRDRLGDIDVYVERERTFTRMLKKWGLREWTGFVWLSIRPS